jgi:hypothetical protein
MDPRLHKVLMPTRRGGIQEVRRFNDLAVQMKVDEVLSGLETNSAILEVEVEKEPGSEEKEIRGVLAAKLNNYWSIAMFGEYRNREDYTGAVRVMLDWS